MTKEIDVGLKELIKELNSFFIFKKLNISTIYSCEGHIENITDKNKLLSENPNMYIMFEGDDCNKIRNKIAKELKDLKNNSGLEYLICQNEKYNNKLILGFYLTDVENNLDTIIKFNTLKYEFQNIFWRFMEK